MTKPKGRHPVQRLSAATIRTLATPGRYADGNGLYLVVEQSGAKHWVLRLVVQGKRRDMGLGGWPLHPLADCRKDAEKYRRIARQGGDPFTERDKETKVIPTFESAARQVHAEHKPSWKNAKHADQWINTLSTYVFPIFGSKRIDQINSADVLHALSPIWLTKQETARRVLQRIGMVLDWAKAKSFRSGDNPVTGIKSALPKQQNNKEEAHHAALPYSDVPRFIHALKSAEDVSEVVKLAFEFLILTASRTSEVIKAQWSEFDLSTAVWTLPASRMKAKRTHRVPLSARCLAILARMRELSGGSDYAFPGRSIGKPLSNMAFLMALRRMHLTITAHGFRSSFRDWAAEQTNFANEVCEAALAHTVSNKVEAAYRRADLFAKRTELMAAWAAFATTTA